MFGKFVVYAGGSGVCDKAVGGFLGRNGEKDG